MWGFLHKKPFNVGGVLFFFLISQLSSTQLFILLYRSIVFCNSNSACKIVKSTLYLYQFPLSIFYVCCCLLDFSTKHNFSLNSCSILFLYNCNCSKIKYFFYVNYFPSIKLRLPWLNSLIRHCDYEKKRSLYWTKESHKKTHLCPLVLFLFYLCFLSI